MNKIIKRIFLVLIALFFVTFAYGYNVANEKFLSLKQSEKKWGVLSFDAKKFTTLTEEKKGAMAVDLIKNKKYINSYLQEVRKEMGDPDSYFFSDTIMAYEITPPEANKEQWQIIFIPDDNLERVKEIKIHKKCCYK